MKTGGETDVLNQCLAWLSLMGIFCWRNNSTGIFDPAKQTFRSFQGMRGTSDILGCLKDGRFLAVEVKSKSGRVTAEQQHFLATVKRLGGVAIVARGISDLEKGLVHYL